MEERIYTIPLLRAKMAPRTRRAKKAVRLVKEFLQKHMKVEDVRIDSSLNELIWSRGLRKVPSKVRVKAVKTEETVWAYTPEAEVKIEEKKEKRKEEAKEIEETKEGAEEAKEMAEKVEAEKEEMEEKQPEEEISVEESEEVKEAEEAEEEQEETSEEKEEPTEKEGNEEVNKEEGSK